MSNDETSSLEHRVAALERRIAQLEARNSRGIPNIPPPPPPPRRPPVDDRARARERWFNSGEGWLGRAGVALVVVSFVFLYRYAVDQGWLTPAMRVALGVLVGAAMLVGGLLFFAERRVYRQILMGGGIVLLFLAGLVASELYALVPGPVALLWQTAIAGIAFHIASRQDDAVMASIAAAGALTPSAFLFADVVPGYMLTIYLLIVVGWAALLILRRSWRSLLVVAAASAMSAVFTNVGDGLASRAGASLTTIAVWVAFAALPLAHARLRTADASQRRLLTPALRLLLPSVVTLGVALATEFDTHLIESFEQLTLFATAGFALLAFRLHPSRAPHAPNRPGEKRTVFRALAEADDFVAALWACAIAAAAAILSGIPQPACYFVLALLAATTLHAGFRFHASALVPLAHLFAAFLGLSFLAASEAMAREALFDRIAVVFAGVFVVAIVMAALLRRSRERLAYLAAAFIMLHVLLATELGAVPGARWLASAAYAVVGSGLILVGLSRSHLLLQRAGMMSLALLVARLFLFDLENAGFGVRIILFMFCGFAFLGLSYLFRERRRLA